MEEEEEWGAVGEAEMEAVEEEEVVVEVQEEEEVEEEALGPPGSAAYPRSASD